MFATSTPRAIVYSAVTTMAAFGTLALSEHPGTASMGALLAIGLGAALFAVLSLTPVLIRWAETGRRPYIETRNGAGAAFFAPTPPPLDPEGAARRRKGGR